MYISRDDLMLRFGETEILQLERNISRENGIESTEQAIQDACDMVNSYLAKRYALPLKMVTEPLKRAVAVIARYYLYKSRPTEQVRLDYEDVMSWLVKISNGTAVLWVEQKDEKANHAIGVFVV